MAKVSFAGSSSGSAYLGGITSTLQNYGYVGKIVNCVNYGTISGSGSCYGAYLAGIVSDIYATQSYYKAYIYNCINYGEIKNSCSATYYYIGGIIGYSWVTTITNCVSAGKFTLSKGYAGNFVGMSNKHTTTVTHCYWTSDTNRNNYYGTKSGTFKNYNSSIITVSSGDSHNLNTYAAVNNWNNWTYNNNKAKINFVVLDGKGFSHSKQLILLPEAKRRGYAFLFWCVDQNSTDSCKKKYDRTMTSTFTSESTLYAQWVVTNCSVSFDVNGGYELPEDEKNRTKVFEEEIGELPVTAMRGYTLIGWFTAYDELFTSKSLVNNACNCSLIAHWDPNNYTVIFDVNGGDKLANNTKKVTFDSPYGDFPIPNKNGFTFDVWKTDDNISITTKTVVNITSNQILYAQWKSNIYTVMLDENGGDKLVGYEKGIKVPSDKAYELLPKPNRRGYTFIGWYTEDDGLITNDTATTAIVTKDQTLHAEWIPNNYTVMLNVTGGDELTGYEDGVTVTFNTTYDILPTPTRTGYEFTSWYTEEEKEFITNGCTVNITKDCTFYANWTANIYEISFDPCGGDGLDGMQVIFDTKYDCLPTPSREGYTFLWWYIKGTNEIIYDTTIVGTACDHTLCAAWNKNTIIFDVNGGDALDDEKMEITYGGTYKTLPTPTRRGYTFDGWYTDDGVRISGGSTITISTGQTVHARWTPNDYIMPLNPNGGVLADSNIKVTYHSPYGTLPTPKRTGYTFIGWITENGETITIDTIVTDPCGCVLSAGWVVNRYSITFILNGGHFTGDVKGVNVTYEEAYGYLPTPVRSGYEFSGWFNEDGAEITAESKVDVADDQTLYAEWTGNEYTVTLNPNGGELAEDDRITVTYGGTYESLPTPIRTGYSLSGWLTDNNELITSEYKVEITRDHTLRAEWKANEYTVTLDLDGGEELVENIITVTYGDTYECLPTPAWKGHVFAGWFDDDSNGEEITADTIVSITEDQTLHARWEEVQKSQEDLISIVFGKKDLNEEEIRDILKIFTDAEFTIASIEYTESGETMTIIRFDDGTKVGKFLTAIVESSDEMKKFIRISYSSSKVDASISSIIHPFITFNYLLI